MLTTPLLDITIPQAGHLTHLWLRFLALHMLHCAHLLNIQMVVIKPSSNWRTFTEYSNGPFACSTGPALRYRFYLAAGKKDTPPRRSCTFELKKKNILHYISIASACQDVPFNLSITTYADSGTIYSLYSHLAVINSISHTLPGTNAMFDGPLSLKGRIRPHLALEYVSGRSFEHHCWMAVGLVLHQFAIYSSNANTKLECSLVPASTSNFRVDPEPCCYAKHPSRVRP